MRAIEAWELPMLIAPWLILVFWLNSFNGFVPCATMSLAFVLSLHIGMNLISNWRKDEWGAKAVFLVFGIILVVGALALGGYISLDHYLRPLPYVLGLVAAEILRIVFKKWNFGQIVFAFVYTPLMYVMVSKLVTTLYVPKMMLICITLSFIYVAFALVCAQRNVVRKRANYIILALCIAIAFVNMLALILTETVPMSWYYTFACLPLVNELVKSVSGWSKGIEQPVNYSWWLQPLCGVKESDKPDYRFREIVARNVFVLICIVMCFLVPVTV